MKSAIFKLYKVDIPIIIDKDQYDNLFEEKEEKILLNKYVNYINEYLEINHEYYQILTNNEISILNEIELLKNKINFTIIVPISISIEDINKIILDFLTKSSLVLYEDVEVKISLKDYNNIFTDEVQNKLIKVINEESISIVINTKINLDLDKINII